MKQTLLNPVSCTPAVQTDDFAKEWWMPQHRRKLKEAAARTADVLFIGDSIMHNWEFEGIRSWEKYHHPRNTFNLGFSGDRTEQVLWRLQNGEVDGLRPKLAVLLIGTNNTEHRQDPPEITAAGIRAIIDDLLERLPGIRILLLAIFPRGETADDPMRQMNRSINDRIEIFSDDDRIHFLDAGPALMEADGRLRNECFTDHLHLSEEGYRRWAEAMEPVIAGILGNHTLNGDTLCA